MKVGWGGPHTATEAGWPRAFAKAEIKNYYFSMTTVYGPQEAWFLEGHGSMSEIQEVNQAIEHSRVSKELDRLALADAAKLASATAIRILGQEGGACRAPGGEAGPVNAA